MIALTIDDPEEMSMQVHWMVHHCPVYHDEASDFAFMDKDRISFRKGFVVEEPNVALHVAVQGEPYFPDGLVLVK
jgi:hypothetical protein